jgi:hypothetical protein
MKRRSLLTTGLAASAIVFAGCRSDTAGPDPALAPQFSAAATADAISAMLDQANLALEASGADVRAAMAEYIAAGDEAGATILAKNVGNKMLGADFVPFDPRRAGWSGSVGGVADDITYAIDQTSDAVPPLGGLTAAQTTAAIGRGVATWDALTCSTLPLTLNASGASDIGLYAFLVSGGVAGSNAVLADVQHAGWRDLNFAGGVLAVTITFVFVAGPPTDIDGNGLLDTALREVYFDPSWIWNDNGVLDVDVESVAAHEFGHGLSQGHFGNIFLKNDGSLMAAPRALMNALYAGVYRTLAGTDIGGHCGIWDYWPAN